MGFKSGDSFANAADKTTSSVAEIIKKVTDGVKADYSDSYPASLFKNVGKCKALANKIFEQHS